jgi:glycosyltransferase involved in cell wall biosynthesis
VNFTSARLRIAFVHTHPIQYFTPLYAYLNRNDFEAVPIYLTAHGLDAAELDPGFGQRVKWDVDLLAGTDPIFVPGAREQTNSASAMRLFNPSLFNIIRHGKFDALVLSGHRTPGNYVAFAGARAAGIPVFIRSDTHANLSRWTTKNGLRDLLMPRLYRHFDGALAIGTRNADFYRMLGLPDDRITIVPFAVDNERMIAGAAMPTAERAIFRKNYGIGPDRVAITFVSKLQPRKRADDLIRATRLLAEEGLPVDLVIAGSGEQEAELRAIVAGSPGLNVVFPGFLNQSEVPRLLGASDVFVLPSEDEPWGLIVNEAMCAGLPIVISEQLGCTPDLLVNGVNGHSFGARNVKQLASALRPIVCSPDRRRAMGAQSRRIIDGWSYAQCAPALRSALAVAQQRRSALRPRQDTAG